VKRDMTETTIQLSLASCLILIAFSFGMLLASVFVWQHGESGQVRFAGFLSFVAAIAMLVPVVVRLAP